MIRRLFALIILFVFFTQCRKNEIRNAETFPLRDTDWRISYFRTHGDTSFVDVPFPDWKIQFMKDSTFSLNVSGSISTGKYAWSKVNQPDEKFPFGNLQILLLNWNPPCCDSVKVNSLKTLIETAKEWSTHGVDTIVSIDVTGNYGFFHAQKL